MWFVYYYGNMKNDPLDYGVDMFRIKENAEDFKSTMIMKGYSCELYYGELVSS